MTNYEDLMYSLTNMLEEETADYLDVNRRHINVFLISPSVAGEDILNWDNDPDDAFEGVENETYYRYSYEYRKDFKTLDYEEPVDMIWLHSESKNYTNGFRDSVMTEEEFEKRMEDKKKNICSEMWYEGE